MKRLNLQKATLEELVQSFRDWSYKQAGAIGDDSNDYTKAYNRLAAIGEELRRRGPDARRALLPLLNCTGSEVGELKAYSARSQCRYNVARQLLAVEPNQATATLKDLAANGSSYARFLARLTLSRIQEGFFSPT